MSQKIDLSSLCYLQQIVAGLTNHNLKPTAPEFTLIKHKPSGCDVSAHAHTRMHTHVDPNPVISYWAKFSLQSELLPQLD